MKSQFKTFNSGVFRNLTVSKLRETKIRSQNVALILNHETTELIIIKSKVNFKLVKMSVENYFSDFTEYLSAQNVIKTKRNFHTKFESAIHKLKKYFILQIL